MMYFAFCKQNKFADGKKQAKYTACKKLITLGCSSAGSFDEFIIMLLFYENLV